MDYIIYTIIIILSLIILVYNLHHIYDDDAYNVAFISSLCSLLIAILTLVIFYKSNKPSAMDVYQGKTTLEITYRNGMPVDSVAVFKINKEIK